MSEAPTISLVCCGLIGPAADDGGMVEQAFTEACATQGIVPGTAAYAHCMVGVHQARGQAPVDVFRGLFPDEPGRAEAAALSFERSFRGAIERRGLSAAPGAEETVDRLRDSGVRVCLVTGLSRRLLGVALDTLGWWRRIDLALCPEDVPRGYPFPDLMFTAMLRLGVEDVKEAAFASSTVSGVRCGKRSGAGLVAGVLVGAHAGERLRTAGATHLIPALADLPGLLTERAAAAGGESTDSNPAGDGAPDAAISSADCEAGSPRSATGRG